MIKAVIFDWGRTLFDKDTNNLFSDTKNILDYLHKKYKLAIVSMADKNEEKERLNLLKENKIEDYFESMIFAPDKDSSYLMTLKKLNLKPEEVAIVDDRIIRGIKWGNKNKSLTIWVKKGKFSNELPDQETGNPNFIINDLIELKNIL